METTREHLQPRLLEVEEEEVEGGARVLEGGDKEMQTVDAMVWFLWGSLFTQLGGTEFAD